MGLPFELCNWAKGHNTASLLVLEIRLSLWACGLVILTPHLGRACVLV